MSSKKAERKKAYLEREKKRRADRERKRVMEEGGIEEMAKYLGIKLK